MYLSKYFSTFVMNRGQRHGWFSDQELSDQESELQISAF